MDASITYPLHKAAREGQEEVLLALLQSGLYEVNSGCFDLVRPLHEACLNGRVNCVRILLEFGAQVNICNVDGATPLCDAASKGSVEVVNLLFRYGALVNPPLTLFSPLHEAVIYNHWECAEVLLNHGAKVNASDCHYGTPLHVAAVRGHVNCADVLLRYGANVNATHIHAAALHVSSSREDEAMTRLLLDHGADVYAQDNQDRTARELVPTSGDNGGSGEVLRRLLLAWERNPKPLTHYCRLSVKRAVGNRGLQLLENLHLPLPEKLKEFLLFIPQKTLLG